MHYARSISVISLALALTACGRPFKVETAPGFVELENQADSTEYAYRSTTPEGVSFGIRVIPDEDRGDLAFWTRALTLQLRDVTGYALLSTGDTRSLDGTPGKTLHFGHDEDNKPYLYDVAVYQAQGRLFVVEAGGAKEQFDRFRPQIEWMMKSVKVKCDTFVSPVFASRTCNKW
jgi:hypothetical protein